MAAQSEVLTVNSAGTSNLKPLKSLRSRIMTLTNFADEPNQEKRIAKLREELEKLGGSCGTIEDMPADVEEEFLRHVLEYETAQPITLLSLLENAGVEIPLPADLDDASLHPKLLEIIEHMASMGAY